MRELIGALTNLLNAHAEHIREQTRCHELGVYGRGLQDGRQDVEEADSFYVVSYDDEDDE